MYNFSVFMQLTKK